MSSPAGRGADKTAQGRTEVRYTSVRLILSSVLVYIWQCSSGLQPHRLCVYTHGKLEAGRAVETEQSELY